MSLGAGHGNNDSHNGNDPVFHESISLEGMITDKTRMEFTESFTYPSEDDGNQSSALSSLPNASTRNFFHLGFYNPYFDLEAGEVTTAPPVLLSSRETGDGIRAAFRPFGNPKLQLEAFAEENTLTLNRKTVFGTSMSGLITNSPLEWWRVGTLSKRDDVGPQGRNWDAVGVDTGWRIPLALPLRAEGSIAGGSNGEGRSGFAWLLGFHFNRTLPGEPDNYPLKAGIEFASGDKDFPGVQNGREDRRAYVTYRLFSNPVLVELFANYNDSHYKVVPNIEKTLDEEQSLIPDFLLNSQSRLLNAGVRWNTTQTKPGEWHFPNGYTQFEDTSYFNKSDFFDKTTEHAVTLSLDLFNRQSALPSATNWQLSWFSRGGTENHQTDQTPSRDSRFITLGTDLNFNRQAPDFFQQIGGPGSLSAEVSARYTINFDGDSQALNRTGLSLTAAAALRTEIWEIKAGATLYSYVNQGFSDRIWASISRRLGKDWWAGIEGAYTHRANGHGNQPADEAAVLFTVRHDFEIPVPWLPRRGQATGIVFEDRNNNGTQDPGESGLDRVKVAVGSEQALTGPDGKFTLSAMTEGTYPIIVTPADGGSPGSEHRGTDCERDFAQRQHYQARVGLGSTDHLRRKSDFRPRIQSGTGDFT